MNQKYGLYLMTMSMLSRSMTVVLRSSTRAFKELCLMFLDILSKHRCMGNIMILPLPHYLNSFELAVLSCISCSAFSLGRKYSQFLCVNTFSFPLINLNNKLIIFFLSIGLFNPSCDLYDIRSNDSLLM